MAKQEETQSLLEESSYVRVLGPPSSTSQDRNSVSTPKITADGVDSISLCQINGESFTNTNSTSMDDNFELHMSFLTGVKRDTGSTRQDSRRDEIRTTPLFSGPILGQSDDGLLPQYGLIAERIQDYDGVAPRDYLHEDLPIHTSHLDPRIFLNVNAPWSTFICGSQGSGKSHTLSCILESCLLPSQLGKLPYPLAGIVFHYDHYTSYATSQVCEAAYLCSSGIPVQVLVSPTNYWRMKQAYENLPGLPSTAKKPQVIPLRFQEKHLDVSRMKSMMALNEKDGPMPLYIEVILRILRQMAIDSRGAPGLDYKAFRNNLSLENLTRDQNGPLNLRLDLLESFMETRQSGSKHVSKHWPRDTKANPWLFLPGTLTIVDLSCPFVDDSAACALFSICLEIFLENRGNVGRIVALDEAHKFMNGTSAASNFTESLLQVIRQQRHLATRVVIATQEPTISPRLLDLSTITIVHRFTSPDWFKALQAHLAGISGHEGPYRRAIGEILKTIVSLDAGQALLFSPTAMLDLVKQNSERVSTATAEKLSTKYIKIRVRKRLTADGGQSLMAVAQPAD